MTSDGPDERTTDRAEDLLPEERAVAEGDPETLAAAVLADSDERSAEADAGREGEAGEVPLAEHRHSEDTVEP